jgi:hypothetical protein
MFSTPRVQNLLYANWQRIPLLVSDYTNSHSLTHHFRMLYQPKKKMINGLQKQCTVEICVE